MAGSRAYDLISLIEDARRDVSPALAEAPPAIIWQSMQAFRDRRWTKSAFAHEMAVMAAQRNAKIVGIFARLYQARRQTALSRLSAARLGLSGTGF